MQNRIGKTKFWMMGRSAERLASRYGLPVAPITHSTRSAQDGDPQCSIKNGDRVPPLSKEILELSSFRDWGVMFFSGVATSILTMLKYINHLPAQAHTGNPN